MKTPPFFSVATLDGGTKTPYAMRAAGNGVYVHCAKGTVEIAGQRLGKGDALGIWEADSIAVEAIASAELVLVEVPMLRGVRR